MLHPLEAGRARMKLTDDGIGFEPPEKKAPEQKAPDPARPPGLGLTLIGALAQRIDGTPNWSRDGGTVMTIDFKTGGDTERSEASRVGKEWVSTCRSRLTSES